MAKPTAKETKQYRTLRALSYKGERIEPGTLLTLSKENLKEINNSYIDLVEDVKETKKEAKEKDADKTADADKKEAEAEDGEAGKEIDV